MKKAIEGYNLKVSINNSDILPYSIGALLYSPASNIKIADMIIDKKISERYSLALCLEDTTDDESVDMAEDILADTMQKIAEYAKNTVDSLIPRIFVRVRTPKQIDRVIRKLAVGTSILTGFIFPKYSYDCANEYNYELIKAEIYAVKKFYAMPIIESSDLINLSKRHQFLYEIKDKMAEIDGHIINVRVGGNDFCKEFGIRRHSDETIYDILPVADILKDIVTVFSDKYVISGPVFEYFGGKDDEWKMGMEKELRRDKLCGFIGKTVIHPKQISIVNESLKVRYDDYADALNIMNWHDKNILVGKSTMGERMNEVKTHIKWAEKTLILAEIYGVSENEK